MAVAPVHLPGLAASVVDGDPGPSGVPPLPSTVATMPRALGDPGEWIGSWRSPGLMRGPQPIISPDMPTSLAGTDPLGAPAERPESSALPLVRPARTSRAEPVTWSDGLAVDASGATDEPSSDAEAGASGAARPSWSQRLRRRLDRRRVDRTSLAPSPEASLPDLRASLASSAGDRVVRMGHLPAFPGVAAASIATLHAAETLQPMSFGTAASQSAEPTRPTPEPVTAPSSRPAAESATAATSPPAVESVSAPISRPTFAPHHVEGVLSPDVAEEGVAGSSLDAQTIGTEGAAPAAVSVPDMPTDSGTPAVSGVAGDTRGDIESERRAEFSTQIDPIGPVDVPTQLDVVRPDSEPVRPDLGPRVGPPADHLNLAIPADLPLASDRVSLVGRSSETEVGAQTEPIQSTQTELPQDLDEAETVSRPGIGGSDADEPLSPMGPRQGKEPPLELERPLNRRPVRRAPAPEALASSHAPILEAPQPLPVRSTPDPLPSAAPTSSPPPGPVTSPADVISLSSYRDRRSPTVPASGPIGESSPLPLAAGVPPIARTALAGHRAALTATAGLPLAVGFGTLPHTAPTPVPEIRAIEARALTIVPRSTSRSATSTHEQSTEVPRMAQLDSAMPVVPAGAGRSNPADAPDISTTASVSAPPGPVQSVTHEISGTAAAVPAIASAPAPASAVPGAAMDAAALDALARQLYEPLVRRLRAELRLDREREGTLMDRPW